MKKILITGKDSYIGTSFEHFLARWPEEYRVDTVDMLTPAWRKRSFAGYDCVLHAAGIAHQKETKQNAADYYAVNCDLAAETAEKSKHDGVKQFVFLSSISVYGDQTEIITKQTDPDPVSNYGKSKYMAEKRIALLADSAFKAAILRPPMVYGKNCKGNFEALKKFALKFPVLPDYKNRRSMIYIDNLSAFIKAIIDNEESGVFIPQNEEYICTCEMMCKIREAAGKKARTLKVLNMPVYLLRRFTYKGRKAFGNLVYSDTEYLGFSYCVTSFDDSIRKSL